MKLLFETSNNHSIGKVTNISTFQVFKSENGISIDICETKEYPLLKKPSISNQTSIHLNEDEIILLLEALKEVNLDYS